MYRDRSVPLAQSNLDLSREAYRAGRASFLSILESQRSLLQSRSQYVEAARTTATAIIEMERTIGLPFETLMAEVNATASSKANPEKLNREATP